MAYLVAGTKSPAGSGTASPAYSTRFLPTIWSAAMARRMYGNTVLARICSTEWDEEVRDKRWGEKVQIRTAPAITVSNYQADGAAATPERPSQAVVTVNLDNGKEFVTSLDNVMATQNDLAVLDVWAQAASQQTRIEIEKDFLPLIAAAVPANAQGATAGKDSDVSLGTSGAPLSLAMFPGAGDTSPLAVLAYLAQVLDEKGVPPSGRWALAPPWFTSGLEQLPAAIGAAGGGGYEAGLVARACRFDVYSTIYLPPTGSAYPIIAGHPDALAFASQLSELDLVPMQASFGVILKGLQISGFNVIQPEGLAMAFGAKASGGFGSSAASRGGFSAVTPSDSTILAPNRGILVTAAGGVVVMGATDTVATNLGTLPAGISIPVPLKSVMAATTATVVLVR